MIGWVIAIAKHISMYNTINQNQFSNAKTIAGTFDRFFIESLVH